MEGFRTNSKERVDNKYQMNFIRKVDAASDLRTPMLRSPSYFLLSVNFNIRIIKRKNLENNKSFPMWWQCQVGAGASILSY